MPKKSAAAVVEEEQKAYEEDQAPQQAEKKEDLFPPELGQVEEDDDGRHIERAQRTFKRPYSDEEREKWEKQLVNSTLRAKDLRDDKKEAVSDFNDRIKVQVDRQETAAKQLRDGCTLRSIRCECIWDPIERTYTEVAEDTREVALKRDLTLEEIERFRQGRLPGCAPERWLTGDQALAQMPDDEPEKDDDEEDDDPDILEDDDLEDPEEDPEGEEDGEE